jgi:hypothetical protein
MADNHVSRWAAGLNCHCPRRGEGPLPLIAPQYAGETVRLTQGDWVTCDVLVFQPKVIQKYDARGSYIGCATQYNSPYTGAMATSSQSNVLHYVTQVHHHTLSCARRLFLELESRHTDDMGIIIRFDG